MLENITCLLKCFEICHNSYWTEAAKNIIKLIFKSNTQKMLCVKVFQPSHLSLFLISNRSLSFCLSCLPFCPLECPKRARLLLSMKLVNILPSK